MLEVLDPGGIESLVATPQLREQSALQCGEVISRHRAVRRLLRERDPALHPRQRILGFSPSGKHGRKRAAVFTSK